MNGLFVAVAVTASGLAAVQLYRRRELPVRGRMVYAGLRAATAAVVILLVWNPSLPWGGSPSGPPALVVDTSPSMRAGAEGETAAVRAEAERDAFEGVVVEAPAQLAAAVAAAVEGGAERVVVVTDLRAPDGVALRAVAEQAPVPIEVRDVGGEVVNAGLSALELPERARPGTEVEAVLRVHATSTDPVEVILRIGSDTLARATGVPGAPGTERSVPLRFTLPDADAAAGDAATAGAGAADGAALPALEIRAEVVRASDEFAEDDTRLGVLALDDPAGGIVAVSWTPDWEFRSLLPLLDEVAGLPVTGFFSLGEGRWLRASDAPGVVETAAVRGALARAEMAVLHAPPPEDGAGVLAAATRVPRRLLLAPRGPVPALGATSGQGLGPAQPGEWFVAADLPASPIAADLAGVELLGLPPLRAIRLGPLAGVSPLDLQRGGAGAPVPAFELIAAEGERVVVARAEGFWRWAQRDGAPRELYRRLWSGLAGWLLVPDATTRAAGLGPRGDAALPSASIPVVGGASSRIRVEWHRGDAPVRTDTVALAVDGRGSVDGFDDAGVYRWTATAFESAADSTAAVATGAVVVQPDGAELRAARDLALPDDVAALAGSRVRARGGDTPLRDHPAPWIALVLMLSTEWVGRRRSGLR